MSVFIDVSIPDIFFWSVLEDDLGTKIHSHIKNSFMYDLFMSIRYGLYYTLFFFIFRIKHVSFVNS